MDPLLFSKVVNYMDEALFEPQPNWPLYHFEERSYSRWAATEIITALMDRPLDPPDIVVEEFLLKVTLMASITEDSKKRHIFSVAKEIAEDILHLL